MVSSQSTMIGRYFPDYAKKRNKTPDWLGSYIRGKSTVEKGSLSLSEGFYYDVENEIAVPTARNLIARIDWSLIFDDIPPQPRSSELLCEFLRWLGETVHTHLENPLWNKFEVSEEVSGLSSYQKGCEVHAEVLKTHPKLSDVHKYSTESYCRKQLQQRVIQDAQNIIERWDSYREQLAAEVCSRETPLIYLVDDDRGFGTQSDAILYIDGESLPNGLYVTDFKVSGRPITHSHRCQVEMQRRCVQQYFEPPVRGLVVRFDPFDEDYSISLSASTDDEWKTDAYREMFDRKLTYYYDNKGLGIRLSKVVQDRS